MKKIFAFIVFSLFLGSAFAQVDTFNTVSPPSKDIVKKKKYDLSNRPNDHFMLQLGYLMWNNAPDSINTKGFSRSVNMYFMFDVPFKSMQQLSVGAGLGIGSDHVMFNRTFVDVKGRTGSLRFNENYYGDSSYFKKTKLMTSYLEAPIELRYVKDPENSDKSFKAAVGVKVGMLLKSGTRNKMLRNKSGGTVNDYLLKEASKNYFNGMRVVGTARIGYGHFSLYGSYQITNVLKSGAGPTINPMAIGLTFSGL
ncbi:MAG: outer membrane beta-barrel protein [Niabella sp.]